MNSSYPFTQYSLALESRREIFDVGWALVENYCFSGRGSAEMHEIPGSEPASFERSASLRRVLKQLSRSQHSGSSELLYFGNVSTCEVATCGAQQVGIITPKGDYDNRKESFRCSPMARDGFCSEPAAVYSLLHVVH